MQLPSKWGWIGGAVIILYQALQAFGVPMPAHLDSVISAIAAFFLGVVTPTPGTQNPTPQAHAPKYQP